MPLHKKTYNHGNLIIHFKVKFPTTMEPKNIALIQEALSTSKPSSGKNSGRKKGAEESKHETVDETVEMK